MTTINDSGYLTRITKSGKNNNSSSTRRDWWIVKNGSVPINNIAIGKQHDGLRVRIKVEIEVVEMPLCKE